VLKWKNTSIQIGNKEMAQFHVGEATLSTEVNTFTTGKIVSSDITSQAILPMSWLVMNWWMNNAIQWLNRHLVAMDKHTTVSTGSIMIYTSFEQLEPVLGVQPLPFFVYHFDRREPISLSFI